MTREEKPLATAEDFINDLTCEADDFLSAKKEYGISAIKDSSRYVISISGLISIDTMNHFLREANRHWQKTPSDVEGVYLDLSHMKYAGSSFYNLLVAMGLEHMRKYQKKLTAKVSRELRGKFHLLTLDRLLEIEKKKK